MQGVLIGLFGFLISDEKALEDFNPSFVNAWKTTHNYKQWRSGGHSLVITENAW